MTQDMSSCRTEICAGRMSSTALHAAKWVTVNFQCKLLISSRRSGTFQHAVSQLRQPIQNILLFEWRPDPPFTLVPPHEATHDTPASLSWRVSGRLCCCAHGLLAASRRPAISANFGCRILLVAKRAGAEALRCRRL